MSHDVAPDEGDATDSSDSQVKRASSNGPGLSIASGDGVSNQTHVTMFGCSKARIALVRSWQQVMTGAEFTYDLSRFSIAWANSLSAAAGAGALSRAARASTRSKLVRDARKSLTSLVASGCDTPA